MKNECNICKKMGDCTLLICVEKLKEGDKIEETMKTILVCENCLKECKKELKEESKEYA